MEKITISPKYQVVIPLRVRESMQLKPGQKLQVIQYGDRIELVPQKKISTMRGFLKGISTDVTREEDRA
ncbi:MAG: AbrB/MazE/SpoVT family DNA-binding domain-containing protein [Chlorobiaceae bacterium]|nr:AbrB/MazE/SpoVT family DNA-binding domain-containing protein [Chlorobiaceae bacterium]